MRVLAIIVFCMISNISLAKDFGSYGQISIIIEQDLLEYIKERLTSMGEQNLREHQTQIKDKVVAKIKRPNPVKGISKTTENSTRYCNPSFTVMEDIRAASGEMIHPKGKVINPLDYHDFNESWIFIDSDDQEQLDFAHTKNKTHLDSKIILVNGSPGLQADGSWFYFDQFGEICKKLAITKVPSVIRQAKDKKLIEIEEINLD